MHAHIDNARSSVQSHEHLHALAHTRAMHNTTNRYTHTKTRMHTHTFDNNNNNNNNNNMQRTREDVRRGRKPRRGVAAGE